MIILHNVEAFVVDPTPLFCWARELRDGPKTIPVLNWCCQEQQSGDVRRCIAICTAHHPRTLHTFYTCVYQRHTAHMRMLRASPRGDALPLSQCRSLASSFSRPRVSSFTLSVHSSLHVSLSLYVSLSLSLAFFLTLSLYLWLLSTCGLRMQY